MAQARTWMFTSFNTAHWYNLLTDWKAKGMDSRVRYIVAQLEICPTSGRRHFQGYVELHTGTRISTLKNLFQDNAAHFEQRRGTRDQARDYCMKIDTRDPENISFEIGQFKGKQGKRNDWDEIKSMIHDGAGYDDLVQEFPAVVGRNSRAVGDLIRIINPDATRKKKTDVYVLAGEPGTGKSTTAKTMATRYYPDEPPECYTLGSVRGDNIWFDGYDPIKHKRIIIDEFTSNIPLSYFNMWFDEHGATVQIKGGMVPFLADEVIITSNIHPKDWYPNISDTSRRISFFRRITRAWWISSKGTDVVKTLIKFNLPAPKKNFLGRKDFLEDILEEEPTDMVGVTSTTPGGEKDATVTDVGGNTMPPHLKNSVTEKKIEIVDVNKKPAARTLGESDAVNNIAKQIKLLVINDKESYGYND